MLTVLSSEEQARITELQAQLDKLRSIEEKIIKEIRELIYKIEKI